MIDYLFAELRRLFIPTRELERLLHPWHYSVGLPSLNVKKVMQRVGSPPQLFSISFTEICRQPARTVTLLKEYRYICQSIILRLK